MKVTQRFSADMVQAARDGNQRALDDLVAQCLPLVYNIVGRALNGHADVDDIVQETLLRVVRDLPKLRHPDRFRSWLVAITVHQIRNGWRARSTRPVPTDVEALADVADPGADFVDLIILRLGLQGQHRDVVEATRWLDSDDRELLSLWRLEAAGELTRAEIANAPELPPQHTTVAAVDASHIVAASVTATVLSVLSTNRTRPSAVATAWTEPPTAYASDRSAGLAAAFSSATTSTGRNDVADTVTHRSTPGRTPWYATESPVTVGVGNGPSGHDRVGVWPFDRYVANGPAPPLEKATSTMDAFGAQELPDGPASGRHRPTSRPRGAPEPVRPTGLDP